MGFYRYKLIFLEKPSGVMKICGKQVVGTIVDSESWAFLLLLFNLFLRGSLDWKIESEGEKVAFCLFKSCCGFWYVK